MSRVRTESEDWIKTLRWDLPTDLTALCATLGVPLDDHSLNFKRWKALRDLMTQPAYRACPTQLKRDIEKQIGRKAPPAKDALPGPPARSPLLDGLGMQKPQ